LYRTDTDGIADVLVTVTVIGVDLTGSLGGRMAGLNKSLAVEAKKTFS